MTIQDQVYSIVEQKGPVIPADIYKEVNQDLLTTSALLAELVSSKRVQVSHVKLGGSPLYYTSQQRDRLQNFSNLLHEKEQKAFEALKEKHVLRDSTQDPVVRVALRQMKDFAIPLKITNDNQEEIFWKWYLDGNEDVEPLIRKELGLETPIPKQETQQELPPPVTKPSPKPKPAAKNAFLDSVLAYFESNDIVVHSQEIIKKNEIDFEIDVPSSVGKLRYYCKAKSKKRSNDADLSAAFTQGQFKKLPVIFLADGELTKRAKEMLTAQLQGLTVKRMDNGSKDSRFV